MYKLKKVKSSYAMLFLYFIIMAAIILSVTLIPTYYFMTNKLKQDQNVSNELLLQQIQTSADIMLKQIDTTSLRATVNQNLLNIFFKNYYELYDNLDDYYKDVNKLNQSLNSEKYNNPNIKSIYLYLPKPELVLTENTIYHFEEFTDQDFIDTLIKQPGNSGWMGPRQIDPLNDDYIKIPTGTVISLFRKIPISGNPKAKALVIINVDINAFKLLIKNPERYPNLQFYLTNPNGAIVASYNSVITGNLVLNGLDPTNFVSKKRFWEQAVNGEDTLVSNVMSEYNDWRYLVLLPKKTVLAPLLQMQRVIIGLLSICFLIGIALSFVLSRRYYSPIRKLIRDIIPYSQGSNERTKDDFNTLNMAFQNLLSENTNNRDIIKNNWNIIKDKYIYDILNGNSQWDPRIINYNLKYRYFRVICVERDEVYNYSQPFSEMDKSLVLHNMERICLDAYSTYPEEIFMLTAKVSDKVLTIILNYDDTLENCVLVESLEALQGNIGSELGISCTIGVGKLYREKELVFKSYKEAVNALKCKVFMGYGRIIHFDSERFSWITGYDETKFLAKKNQLIENIKVRNSESVASVIDEIKELLSGISPDHFDRIKFMFANMCQDITKSVYNTGEADSEILDEMFNAYKAIENSQCIDELISVLRLQSSTIIGYLTDKTEKMSCEILNSVLEYIKQHYMENISIDQIAEKAKFNSAYLGRLIKNATGRTFPQYITQLRIEKAKCLINDSNEKINEIYEKVGYTNRQSFIRAFKFHMNMTPSEYRQTQVQNALEK